MQSGGLKSLMHTPHPHEGRIDDVLLYFNWTLALYAESLDS